MHRRSIAALFLVLSVSVEAAFERNELSGWKYERNSDDEDQDVTIERIRYNPVLPFEYRKVVPLMYVLLGIALLVYFWLSIGSDYIGTWRQRQRRSCPHFKDHGMYADVPYYEEESEVLIERIHYSPLLTIDSEEVFSFVYVYAPVLVVLAACFGLAVYTMWWWRRHELGVDNEDDDEEDATNGRSRLLPREWNDTRDTARLLAAQFEGLLIPLMSVTREKWADVNAQKCCNEGRTFSLAMSKRQLGHTVNALSSRALIFLLISTFFIGGGYAKGGLGGGGRGSSSGRGSGFGGGSSRSSSSSSSAFLIAGSSNNYYSGSGYYGGSGGGSGGMSDITRVIIIIIVIAVIVLVVIIIVACQQEQQKEIRRISPEVSNA